MLNTTSDEVQIRPETQPPAADSPHAEDEVRQADRRQIDDRARPARQVSLQVNFSLLAWTIVLLVLATAVLYPWHGYQLRQTARSLLDRAEQLEQDGELDKSVEYLYRYLELYPDDIPVRLRMAEIYDRSAVTPPSKLRATQLYFEALGMAGGLTEQEKATICRRLAELLLELAPLETSRYALAIKQAALLSADDPVGWRVLALARYRQHQAGLLRGARDGLNRWRDGGDSNASAGSGNRASGVQTVGDAFVQMGASIELACHRAQELNPADITLALVLAQIYREDEELWTRDTRNLASAQRDRLADAAMDRLVAADRENHETHLARYFYRLASGQAEAMDDLQTARQLAPDDVGVLLSVARDHVARHRVLQSQRGRAEQADRQWADACEALERAVRSAPQDERPHFLLGQLYWQKNRQEEAIAVWERGIAQVDPDSLKLTGRLADALTTQDRLSEAELWIANFANLVRQRGPRLPRRDRVALYRTLDLLRGHWCVRSGQFAIAEPLLKRVTAECGGDAERDRALQAWLLLATSFVAQGRTAEAENAYQEALRVEPTSFVAHSEAVDAWENAGQGERAWDHYDQMRRRLTGALEPGLQKRYAQFAEAVQAICMLAEWSLASNDSDQIKRWEEKLSALDDDGPFLASYFRMRRLLLTSEYTKTAEFVEAKQILAELMQQRPQWSALHVVQGQMCQAKGDRVGAIRSYQQAVDLGERTYGVVQRLLIMLHAEDRLDEAEALLDLATHDSDLAPHLPILGVINSVEQGDYGQAVRLARKNADRNQADVGAQIQLGETLLSNQQLPEAEQAFLQAVELAPEALVTHSKLFDFYFRTGQKEQARGVLDRLEESPYFSRTAKAVAIARGHYFLRDRSAAVAEIRNALAEDPQSILLRRLLAGTLAGGQETVVEAIEIYEQLVRDSPDPSDDDQLVLGRLYEAQQRFVEAKTQYERLVNRAQPHRSALVALIDILLREQRLTEADTRLQMLEATGPVTLSAVLLRARWLHEMGRTDEIEPLVEPLARQLIETDDVTDEQLARLCLHLGSFYAAVEQDNSARTWYQRVVEFSPANLSQAVFAQLGSGLLGDAVQMCIDASATDISAQPAILLATALSTGEASSEDHLRAEPYLARALSEHAAEPRLHLAIATLRFTQGRYEDAMQRYRAALEYDPENIAALNNLAAMLGEDSEQSVQALGFIDQAIQLVGADPNLLDTKGMIYFHGGELDRAVSLLEEAAAGPQPDPRFHFHLAAAYLRSNLMERARDSFTRSRPDQLETQLHLLTKTERALFGELKRQFTPPADPVPAESLEEKL